MEETFASAQQEFGKIVEIVRSDLATIRTGKASPQLITGIEVEAYDTKMTLINLATVTGSDPTTLIVTPFDPVNASAIAKAIQGANLGLTVVPEETVIRVIVPPLSQERRQEYVGLVKAKTEGGKVMARQARHRAMEKVATADADEDTKKRWEGEIQKLTDLAVEKLELMAREKEKELMTV